MDAFNQFQNNIDVSNSCIETYKELRLLKGLGARGSLQEDEKYILWTLKSSVIFSMGALDAYIHKMLEEEILLKIREAKCSRELSNLVLLYVFSDGKDKKNIDVNKLFEMRSEKDLEEQIVKTLSESHFCFRSYQKPDKIHGLFSNILGEKDIFGKNFKTLAGAR
jgi:hypothetical protein